MTRRTPSGQLAGAADGKAQKPPKEWRPKLGLLGPLTEANVEFARQEGFTNMILGASPRSTLDASTITDEKIEHVKDLLMNEDLTLTEIAYQLEYSSVAHIYAQFKKVKGLTPTYFKHLCADRLAAA